MSILGVYNPNLYFKSFTSDISHQKVKVNHVMNGSSKQTPFVFQLTVKVARGRGKISHIFGWEKGGGNISLCIKVKRLIS